MNKKKLLDEVYKNLEAEKEDRVKAKIKTLVVDLEMAKATVKKLEGRLKDYVDKKDDEIFA